MTSQPDSRQQVSVPNLYVLGPPRTASTSLARWLGDVPGIRTSRPKEPGYHIHDRPMQGRIGDLAEYRSLFVAGGGPGDDDIVYRCDATVWYLSTPGAAESIAGMSPDARLIVTLRNPADVIASLHAHHRYRAIEREPSLERAVFTTRSPDAIDFRRNVDYLHVASVGSHVAHYRTLFSPGQFYFIDFEGLTEEPEVVLGKLAGWLGLDPPLDDVFRHLNRGRRVRVNALRKPVNWLARPSHPARVRRLGSKLRAMNALPGREDAPPEVRRRILDELAEDIALLGELSGRDLRARWR